jgi:hypothetical protein
MYASPQLQHATAKGRLWSNYTPPGRSSWKKPFLLIPKCRCGLATPVIRNESISVRVVWGNTEFRVQSLSLYILFCSQQIQHCFSRVNAKSFRATNRTQCPASDRIFVFSNSSKPVLRPTHPLSNGYRELFSWERKAARA